MLGMNEKQNGGYIQCISVHAKADISPGHW